MGYTGLERWRMEHELKPVPPGPRISWPFVGVLLIIVELVLLLTI